MHEPVATATHILEEPPPLNPRGLVRSDPTRGRPSGPHQGALVAGFWPNSIVFRARWVPPETCTCRAGPCPRKTEVFNSHRWVGTHAIPY